MQKCLLIIQTKENFKTSKWTSRILFGKRNNISRTYNDKDKFINIASHKAATNSTKGRNE